MEIEFDFDVNDWEAFQKHHLQNSKQFNRTKIILTFIFPALVCAILYHNFLEDDLNLTSVFIFSTAAVLWIIFFPKRLIKRSLRNSKRMIEREDNSGILGNHKIIITNEGIEHIISGAEAKMKWSSFNNIEESVNHYFLYSSSVSALVIPKDKIDDIDEFDKMLRSNIS